MLVWSLLRLALVDLFKTEQLATEVTLRQLEAGGVLAPTRKAYRTKEKRLKTIQQKFTDDEYSLGRAWASPTLTWLHCGSVCVSICACLFGPTTYHKFQMSTFKYFTMIACQVHALPTRRSKSWEWAWRATARLQVRREGELEQRRFKLNVLAAHTATLILSEVWYWHGSYESDDRTWIMQGRLRVRVTENVR